MTGLELLLLLIDHRSQSAVAARQRDQVFGDAEILQGSANVFTGHASIYGFCELGVVHARSFCDVADGVFVTTQPRGPLVAEDSKFLYCLTHFRGNLVGFFWRNFIYAPLRKLLIHVFGNSQ